MKGAEARLMGRSAKERAISEDWSDDGSNGGAGESGGGGRKSGVGPGGAEPGGRVHALLATYYGMQSSSDRAAQSNDIDSAVFDSEAFVRQLLNDSKVESLLRRDNQMVHEVKKLDSDMQMLVYENYNKFISATDTIRKMKQNVESMEAEMGSLVKNMDRIGESSAKINGKLAGKRERIDKLVRVRRLLKRLEFLFELPQKLQEAVEQGSFGQAIRYFAMTKDILKKHSSVASFAAILHESEDRMRSIKDVLSVKVRDPNVKEGALLEYVPYLLDLGVPRPWLRDRFFEFYAARFAEFFVDSGAALVDDASVSLESCVGQLSKGFLPMLLRAVTVYERLFLPPPAHSGLRPGPAGLQPSASPPAAADGGASSDGGRRNAGGNSPGAAAAGSMSPGGIPAGAANAIAAVAAGATTGGTGSTPQGMPPGMRRASAPLPYASASAAAAAAAASAAAAAAAAEGQQDYVGPLKALMRTNVDKFFRHLDRKVDLVLASAAAAASAAAVAAATAAPPTRADAAVAEADADARLHGVVATLQQLVADVEMVDEQIPAAGLPARASSFVRAVKMKQALGSFRSLCASAADNVASLAATVEGDGQLSQMEGLRSVYRRQTGYQALLEAAVSEILKETEKALVATKQLATPDGAYDAGLSAGSEEALAVAEHIHRCVWWFVIWLCESLQRLAGVLTAGAADAPATLPSADDDHHHHHHHHGHHGHGDGGSGGGGIDDAETDADADGAGDAAAGVRADRAAYAAVAYDPTALADAVPTGGGGGWGSAVAPPGGAVSGRSLLLFACLAREVGNGFVPKAGELLTRHVPLPPAQRGQAAAVAEPIRRLAQRFASRSLSRYVEVTGCRLARIARDGIEASDGQAVPEPTQVGLDVMQVLEGVERAASEASAFLGEARVNPIAMGRASAGGMGMGMAGGGGYRRASGMAGGGMSGHGSLPGGSGHGGIGGGGGSASLGGGMGGGMGHGSGLMAQRNLQLDVDRIFASEVSVFGGVRFTGDSIVGGVLKVVLKAMCECCRLCTLAGGAFRQMQADVEFLHQVLPIYVTDGAALSMLGNMLDQVVIAAETRALDPAPLQQRAVADIVTRALGRFS